MSKIFVETMARAIADYRYLLRRYLSQSQRMAKLNELNLRDPNLFDNEIAVYHLGHRIVRDIEQNMDTQERSYYSYSGIARFCDYLKEFLANYEIETGKVIHKAQKASRCLIHAIQLLGKSEAQLTPDVAKELLDCNQVIGENGSVEQKDLYFKNLARCLDDYPKFYQPIIEDFEQYFSLESSQQSRRSAEHYYSKRGSRDDDDSDEVGSSAWV